MSGPETRSMPTTLDEQVARLIADDLIIGGFYDPACAGHEIDAITLVKDQLMAGEKTLIKAIFGTYFYDESFLDNQRMNQLIADKGVNYIASPQIIIPEIAQQLTEFLAFSPEKQHSLATEVKQVKDAAVASMSKWSIL